MTEQRLIIQPGLCFCHRESRSLLCNVFDGLYVIQCMSLGPEFISSKVISLQMIAKMCLRYDYQSMSPSILARFYQLLHKALLSGEQVS